jgi:hypothetical protein
MRTCVRTFLALPMRSQRLTTHRTRLHARHTVPVLYVLLLGHTLLASVAVRAQPQRERDELGVSGYVLAPDGTPVSAGTVMIQSRGVRETMSIGRTGRFRLAPAPPGGHEIFISVSGFAPYRARVMVPPSGTLRLPVIRLSPATYFRVRFVSAAGEPITSPRVLRTSLDVSGFAIQDPLTRRGPDEIESDGTTTIGPLPRGVTTLALDTPPLTRTRLPDQYVTGKETLLDGGSIIVETGATLHVDLVDGTGAPVPGRDVFLEEALPLSPLGAQQARTNHQGRATFDRVGAARYRVRTAAARRCADRFPLSIARVVSVSGNGTQRIRLVIDGNATFQVTSSLGPVRGTLISAAPEPGPSSPPGWVREQSNVSPYGVRPPVPFSSENGCRGSTDGDGRLTLTRFPPGPARINVQLRNSTWVQRVNVPTDGRELAIEIPGGYLPLRVINVRSGQPVAGAAVKWSAGGASIEAITTANGEALLEGVGVEGGGTLAIAANGYQPTEAKLSEPPAILEEYALVPLPDPNLQARVTTASGEPLPNAVVELTSENPFEVDQIATTDAKGFVGFSDLPRGGVRLTASADQFVTTATRISEDARTGVVLTLSRGYRVAASVEASAESGAYLVRILNDVGVSLDRLLDVASDRTVEPRGRVSLGPLAPGTYVVDLRGPREHWQQRVRIVDRDVHVTFP